MNGEGGRVGVVSGVQGVGEGVGCGGVFMYLGGCGLNKRRVLS